jgi:hypothetical protein
MSKLAALLVGIITGKAALKREDPAEDWSKDCGGN